MSVWRTDRVYEAISVANGDLRVVHPRCGRIATVTDYNVDQGVLVAICHHCSRYVYLEFANGRSALRRRRKSDRGDTAAAYARRHS